jgi:hypothetical protein
MSEDMIAKQAAKITRLYNKNKELGKEIKDLRKIVRTANDVIDPAVEILPDTYNSEIAIFEKLRSEYNKEYSRI